MNQWLISVEELHQLKGSNIVIFDCRFSLAYHNMGKTLYQQGHIPGAHHVDMEKDLSGPKGLHGGRHPLPEIEVFSTRMRRCGVNHNTLVVAYDNNRLAGAARLWWLLGFFGHHRVKILNGGLSAWQAAGFSVTDDDPASSEGDFEAMENLSLVVDHHWVTKYLTNRRITLIDSREAPRYLGREEPIDPAMGHIPGAVNAPWQQVTNEAGFARPQEQQQKIWQALPIADNPVVYCGSGITACVNLLSLSLAGMDNTRLYAGSWSDWCSYPTNPIEPPRTEQPRTEPSRTGPSAAESTQVEPPSSL